MTTWSRRRLVVVSLLAVAAVVPLFPLASSYRFLDIEVSIDAADTVLRGGDLYSYPIDSGYYFTHPPFDGLASVPIGLPPKGIAHGLWSAMILPLLAVSVLAAPSGRGLVVTPLVRARGVLLLVVKSLSTGPVAVHIRFLGPLGYPTGCLPSQACPGGGGAVGRDASRPRSRGPDWPP